MGRRTAGPAPVGIKGHLWERPHFQDGSHETHLVCRVGGQRGAQAWWDFLTPTPPLHLLMGGGTPTSHQGPILAQDSSREETGDYFLELNKRVPDLGEGSVRQTRWHLLLPEFSFLSPHPPG